jgi:hypothetical protein
VPCCTPKEEVRRVGGTQSFIKTERIIAIAAWRDVTFQCLSGTSCAALLDSNVSLPGDNIARE